MCKNFICDLLYIMNVFTDFISFILAKPIGDTTAVSHFTVTSVIYAAVVAVIWYFVYLFFRVIVNIQIRRKKIRNAQGKNLVQLIGYIITILALVSATNALGYSLSYLLVGSTALLVGIGFGLQQLFLDLVSGVILLIDKNINIGDVVKVDIPSGRENMYGKIHHIGLRATLLQNIDNEFIIIPNSKILSSGMKSLMRDKGSARYRINVQVGFNENMDKVKQVMMDAILSDSRVDHEPSPTIIIREFKDSGILLEIRFWMKELFNSEIILSDLRFKILDSFRSHGIHIPYPHQVLQAQGQTIELKVKPSKMKEFIS